MASRSVDQRVSTTPSYFIPQEEIIEEEVPPPPCCGTRFWQRITGSVSLLTSVACAAMKQLNFSKWGNNNALSNTLSLATGATLRLGLEGVLFEEDKRVLDSFCKNSGLEAFETGTALYFLIPSSLSREITLSSMVGYGSVVKTGSLIAIVRKRLIEKEVPVQDLEVVLVEKTASETSSSTPLRALRPQPRSTKTLIIFQLAKAAMASTCLAVGQTYDLNFLSVIGYATTGHMVGTICQRAFHACRSRSERNYREEFLQDPHLKPPCSLKVYRITGDLLDVLGRNVWGSLFVLNNLNPPASTIGAYVAIGALVGGAESAAEFDADPVLHMPLPPQTSRQGREQRSLSGRVNQFLEDFDSQTHCERTFTVFKGTFFPAVGLCLAFAAATKNSRFAVGMIATGGSSLAAYQFGKYIVQGFNCADRASKKKAALIAKGVFGEAVTAYLTYEFLTQKLPVQASIAVFSLSGVAAHKGAQYVFQKYREEGKQGFLYRKMKKPDLVAATYIVGMELLKIGSGALNKDSLLQLLPAMTQWGILGANVGFYTAKRGSDFLPRDNQEIHPIADALWGQLVMAIYKKQI